MAVSDISNGHVYVRTLSGPITIRNVHRSHLDIHSVGGDLNIHNVTDSALEAYSGSGQITYDGDSRYQWGLHPLQPYRKPRYISIPASESVANGLRLPFRLVVSLVHHPEILPLRLVSQTQRSP